LVLPTCAISPFPFVLRPYLKEFPMTTSTSTNGQVRKTLASQLDRLDAILDSLGEGLNQAVATAVEQAVEIAVREGVHQGVRGALSEILTNPEILTVLRAALAPESANSQTSTENTPAAPTSKGVGFFGRALGKVKAKARQVRQACTSTVKRSGQRAVSTWKALQLLRPFRTQILTALGVGALVGVGAFFAGPYVAAAAGWLGGFVSTLAVQAGVAFRRLTAQAVLIG
jgi:hypothetical protein